MPKFAKRLLVAAILLLVLAAILHMGGWLQCAIFTIGAIASVFEISNAFEKRDRKPFMLPAYLYAAGYFALYRLFGGEAVWLLGIFMVMLALMERIWNRTRTTEDAFFALIPLVYPLASLRPLAAVAGHSVRLGPAVPQDGSGVLGGAVGGVLVYALEGLYPAGVSLQALLVLGLFCGVFGQFGDLFASAIKRWAGIKDYSRIFSEHGGMLDRLDSVLFCAPIVYAVFKIMGV